MPICHPSELMGRQVEIKSGHQGRVLGCRAECRNHQPMDGIKGQVTG